jgi:hypothetical protein
MAEDGRGVYAQIVHPQEIALITKIAKLLVFYFFSIAAPVLCAELPCDEMESRVKLLINEVAIPSTDPSLNDRFSGKQAKIFKQLEDIGRPAVPYIIKYMDDRRLLPHRYLKLDNKGAHPFEPFRQYGPVKVVDALAAILNQLTGRRFGDLDDGRRTTDEQRDQVVAAWRQYLKDYGSQFRCPSKEEDRENKDKG